MVEVQVVQIVKPGVVQDAMEEEQHIKPLVQSMEEVQV